MRGLKRHFTTILLVGVLIAGLVLLGYPTFSDWWNSFHQTRAILSYAQNVANLDEERFEELWSGALKYNEELGKTGIKWTLTKEEEADYDRQLAVDTSGNMGYINIPKINVMLPLYHGTTEAVLQTAIGHIEGTSLPVGGESSHCVLSGHRGLPSAKLFTDLDRLIEGDRFTLNILDQVLTYEVDQIRIVEPTDLSDLQIEKGQDYCTLVTCTPYGINTHRLLVRGHRVENDMEADIRVPADAILIEEIYVAPFVAGPILVILFIVMMAKTSDRAKRKKHS